MRVRVRFERVQQSRMVKTKCTGPCKARHSKLIKLEHTVNPFNKDADGVPKTREEVARDVSTKLEDAVLSYTLDKIRTPCVLCGGVVVEVKRQR